MTFRKITSALILLLFLSGVSPAAPQWRSARTRKATPDDRQVLTAVSNRFENVGRIKFQESSSATIYGSGAYLGDGLFLSCAHVFTRGREQNARVQILFQQTGETLRGSLVKIDRGWDLSLTRLDRLPQKITGIPLAQRNIQVGDSVTFIGYPKAGPMFSQGPARVTQYVGNGKSNSADWFESNLPVISGYSGGPAINQLGRLIGPLWGSDHASTTVATQTGRTRIFLGRWLDKLRIWHTQCGGGSCHTPGRSGGAGNYGSPVPPTPEQQLRPAAPAAPQATPIAAAPGSRGPAGPRGPAGSPGKITTEQLEILANTILKRMEDNPAFQAKLPQQLFVLEFLDAGGNVARSQPVQIGGTAKIPAARLLIHDQGQAFEASAPLGEAIEIEVTGVLK